MGCTGMVGSHLLKVPQEAGLRRKSTVSVLSTCPIPQGVRLVVALLSPKDRELCSQADLAATCGSPAHLLGDLGQRSYLSEPWPPSL